MNLSEYQNQIWKTVIEWKFGFCQRISLKDVEPLWAGPEIDSLPILQVQVKPKSNVKSATIFIHSDYDLPDAIDIQSKFRARLYSDKVYLVTIYKSILSRISTSNSPCSNFSKIACGNRLIYPVAFSKFSCDPSIYQNDTYLYAFQEEPRIHSKPFCTNDQFNEMYGMIKNELKEKCISREPCKYEKFDIVLEEFSQSNENLQGEPRICERS